MPALGTHELSQIQAAFAAWRTEVCQIERPAGPRSNDYTTVQTVSCRRTPDIIPPVERAAVGQVVAQMRWWIALPPGTEVRASDRLRIEGRVYQVQDDQDRTDEVQRRVLATELS